MDVWFYCLTVLAIGIFIGWCFVWTMHLMAIINGRLKLHRKLPTPSLEIPLPGVSILKPLVGVDPNLYSNLETYFTLNYPLFELLFCVQEESDPAIMVVQKLISKFPNVDAKLYIGGEKVGINPKINNMQPGYVSSKYNFILISDSSIKMKEDTLLDMVLHMTDEVGEVHQMPFTCDRKGFPAILEKVFFGTAHARVYLTADVFGINCATGMSCLFRKKLLDEAGGIKAFGQYLAEDFFFAKSIMEKGYKIKISSHPAWQNSGLVDIPIFQERLMRWAKLRFTMVPHTILLEPLSECILLGTIAAWAISFLFRCDYFVVLLVHLLVWFLLDSILLCVIQNGGHPFSKWDFVIAWMFRECSAVYLFLKALWNPEIRWRMGTYKLRWGGVAQEVKSLQV